MLNYIKYVGVQKMFINIKTQMSHDWGDCSYGFILTLTNDILQTKLELHLLIGIYHKNWPLVKASELLQIILQKKKL